VKLVLSSSSSSRFLTLSAAAEVSVQVKGEVTSKDTALSQFQMSDLLHKVGGVLYMTLRVSKMEASSLMRSVTELMLLIMGLSGTPSLCISGSP